MLKDIVSLRLSISQTSCNVSPLVGTLDPERKQLVQNYKAIFTAMLDFCFCEAIKSRFFGFFKALILIDYLERVLANKKKIGVVPWFSNLDV